MKKIIFAFLFLPLFCLSQMRGVWGIGALVTHEIRDHGFLHTNAAYQGYQIDVPWDSIEKVQGVYNFTSMDAKIQEAHDSGLLVGISVPVNQDCPNWLKTLAGSYKTDISAIITFPRQYNPVYKSAYYKFYKKVVEHLSSNPYVSYLQSKEGTTGDSGPYHGSLLSQYIGDSYIPQNGDDATWEAFRTTIWDSINYYRSFYSGTFKMLINTGNYDHQYSHYVDSLFPGSYIKEGALSHNYNFDGTALYDILEEDQLSRGEQQSGGYLSTSTHKNKDAFLLVVNATVHGLGMLSLPQWWETNFATGDTRCKVFFNSYANDTLASTSNKAFIYLGNPISVDSLVEWPENVFGLLIKNSDTIAYRNQINNINNGSGSNDFKAHQRMNKTIDFTNQNRIDSLTLYNGIGGRTHIGLSGSQYDDWGNDLIWSGVNNYGKFIKQNNPHTTSIISCREGVDSSIYGRYDRGFKITSGTAPNITFDIDNYWNDTAILANVTFDITYLDYGGGKWTFRADTGTGMVKIFSITNSATSNQWVTKEVTVNNMVLGNSDDFELRYISGSNTKFGMIQIKGTPVILYTYYHDLDGDGFGNPNSSIQAASQPLNYVVDNSDCDDNDSLVYPNAPEICDGKDNNCNGFVDEGVKSFFYQDLDGDGYGDINNSVLDCSAPLGFVSDNTDCNDSNPLIHPGMTEVCGNSLDDNCDGQIDEACALPNISIFDTTISENIGTSHIRVHLSTVSSFDVKVDYVTRNNTATAPKDYKIVKGTLTISHGSVNAYIDVPIVKDKIFESTETFFIKLSNPINATISDDKAIISITNF